MKELHRKSLYHYATALFVFLCYLGMCIAVFFYGIQHAVEGTTRAQLAENVTKQCDHLKDVIGWSLRTWRAWPPIWAGRKTLSKWRTATC